MPSPTEAPDACDMRTLVRNFDWAATPLGAMESWPQALRLAVSICLGSSFPTAIYCGPELRLVYNDAWTPIAADRHPRALGRPGAEVWSDIWHVVGPQLDQVIETGQGFSTYDQPLPMVRDGIVRETYWIYSFTPIRDEQGQIVGVFNQGHETTARVLGERRQRIMAELDLAIRELADPFAIMNAVTEMLGRHLHVARAGYGEVEPSGEVIRVDRDWADGVRHLSGRGRLLHGFGTAIVEELRAGRTLVVTDSKADPRVVDASPNVAEIWAEIGVRAAVAVPLIKDGQFVAFLYLHQRTPRAWPDDEISIAEEVAERTWAALERARAEKALRESEASLAKDRALLATLVDHLPTGVIVVDRDAATLICNPAYRRIVPEGTIPSQLPNAEERWIGYDAQGQRVRRHDFAGVRALRGETVVGTEFLHLSAEGEETWVRLSAVPLRDPAGEIFGALCVVVDIDNHKRVEEELRHLTETLEERIAERTAELLRAEEALRQSQKLESMGQLTGGVAHDFNNLLAPIIGSLDLLHRNGVGNDRERRLIDGALQAAERAKTLVQRLLAFARRQPLQVTAVDLKAVIEGMVDLIASTSGPRVRVQLDLAEDLSAVLADSNQLEMAILNLAVNARDAMPESGTLTIAAADETIEGSHRSKLTPGHYVHLSVADSGIGMDEATLARAVEPFFSTKGVGQGTGLGLSMVHGLASQLGGALDISSKPGLGTRVELWLPASGDRLRPGTAGPAHAAPAPARGTALLVDDEDLVRASTAQMLSDLGYGVVEASSAEEALRAIDGGLVPDLLVSDHLMPGMAGTELAREVRNRLPQARVLIISGYADVEAIAPDLPRLSKPFRYADLAEALTSAG